AGWRCTWARARAGRRTACRRRRRRGASCARWRTRWSGAGSPRPRSLRLTLGLQLPLVLLDEGADVVRHVQQLLPLLFVERDREASQAIDGHRALLAHLHRDPAGPAVLQRLVLGLEALQLGLQLLLVH